VSKCNCSSQKPLLTIGIWTRNLWFRSLGLRPLDQPAVKFFDHCWSKINSYKVLVKLLSKSSDISRYRRIGICWLSLKSACSRYVDVINIYSHHYIGTFRLLPLSLCGASYKLRRSVSYIYPTKWVSITCFSILW
jgi:hypothetical protein